MVKILVTDDDEGQRLRIRHVVTAAGHEALEAGDGVEALARIETTPVEIAILDWDMPNMDGLALCRAIRQRSLSQYVYIIFLTSHTDKKRLVEAMEAGADDFLSKPAHPAELRVRIEAGERILALVAKDMTIFALAKLAESRDPETGQHLERVQGYCELLANRLRQTGEFAEVTADYVRLIVATCPLHDIGKVAVPDHILQKPGKLDADEFEIMKTHASQGAETLKSVLNRHPAAAFLRMATDIAESHHEKFDGSGYPAGQSGEQIPLSARIMALADVYDALTTRRCYKEPFEHEVARKIIVEGSGKHFDARVVNAFLAVEQRFVEVKEALQLSARGFYGAPTLPV